MSDEKTYTEREKVLAERAAFGEGVSAFNRRAYDWPGSVVLAAERYPLPKVTRRRRVPDPHLKGVEWVYDGETFDTYSGLPNTSRVSLWEVPTPARVKMWADLLANPTEEVEAE